MTRTAVNRTLGIAAAAGLGVAAELGLAYLLLITIGIDASRVLDIDIR